MKPLSFCCLGSVIKKEFRQIRRDVRSLAFMAFLPAFMLLLFGFALNFDVKHIPLAVVDEDGSRTSRDLVDKFRTTEYFNLKAVLPKTAAIDPLMAREDIRAALVIPARFSEDLLAGRSPCGPSPGRRFERHERLHGRGLCRRHPPGLFPEDHPRSARRAAA